MLIRLRTRKGCAYLQKCSCHLGCQSVCLNAPAALTLWDGLLDRDDVFAAIEAAVHDLARECLLPRLTANIIFHALESLFDPALAVWAGRALGTRIGLAAELAGGHL